VALLERVTKLAGDLSAVFDEVGICPAARRLSVPTLLFSGSASPQPTQQMTKRLASMIPGARHIHLAAAGHMLPITHASELNPKILQHIDATQSNAEVAESLKAGAGA
jgi:pimeloyl-ACP methyl ester carboxylesterase